MTGEAEEQREVLPDPLRPTLVNGSFEDVLDGATKKVAAEPAGWHYQRQLKLVDDPATAPNGRHFVTFTNDEPGLAAHALQGFAIDGRKVSQLQLDFSVRGKNIRPGRKPTEWPMIVFTFYDDRRAVIDEVLVGPFDGTFNWQQQSHTVRVPLKARECILRIGLLGAVGELSLDDLKLTTIE